MLQYIWGACIFLNYCFCFLQINKSRIAGSYGSSNFNFLRNFHTVFSSGCTNLHSYRQCTRVPFFPHSHWHIISVPFDNSHSDRYEVNLIVVLTCISLMINDVEHLFMYLLAIRMSFLGKCLFRSFAHFLIDCFNDFPFEKHCLACYWALVLTECLTMDYQVAMEPELPIMFWVLSDPPRHTFGCVQQHSLIQWRQYIYDWVWADPTVTSKVHVEWAQMSMVTILATLPSLSKPEPITYGEFPVVR